MFLLTFNGQKPVSLLTATWMTIRPTIAYDKDPLLVLVVISSRMEIAFLDILLVKIDKIIPIKICLVSKGNLGDSN